MIWLCLLNFFVQLKGYRVVGDSEVQLTYRVVAAASVEIGICILGIHSDYFREISDCIIVLGKSLERNAAVMKSMNVSLVILKNLSVVCDGLVILAKFGKTVRSVIECL